MFYHRRMDELPRKRRRGVYLLPNLFTTGTLFGGFYAIVASMNGEFEKASIAIFAAMVADSLDGFIARKTHTASDFGKEYDSLCDMVAFGVAASLVMYSWSLHFLSQYKWLGGKLGWVAAFTYTACAALRLARFNVLATRGGAKGNFFGMPSPAAAAVTTGFVWMCDSFGFGGDLLVIPATIITVGAACLMVTNIPFFSLKSLKLTERVPFRYIVFVIVVLALFSIDPPLIFFLVFFLYSLTGPVGALRRRLKKPAPPVQTV
ncbi:MAG TPA: CDP-diacylglycerol--serine O-phosphatidyltransferase [Nevskiaceae bacterium]|nr:CDP-diacylglycerol--serine O-phosphatidyltransferase [Nevskiaceae bacterium]